MRSIFSRRPEWIRNALRLEEPYLPTNLATDQVVPVLDIGGSGFGADFEIRTAADDVDGSTGGTVLEETAGQGWLITCCELTNVGASGRTISLRVGKGSAGSSLLFRNMVMGANSAASSHDILGSVGGKLWIPPGYRMQLAYTAALLAAETVTFTMLVLPVYKGYRPY